LVLKKLAAARVGGLDIAFVSKKDALF